MKKHTSLTPDEDKILTSDKAETDLDTDFEDISIAEIPDVYDGSAASIEPDILVPFQADAPLESGVATPYHAIHFSDAATPEPEPIPLPLHAFDGIQSVSDDPDFQGMPQVQVDGSTRVKSPRIRPNYWIKAKYLLIPLAIIASAVLLFSVLRVGNFNERLASPLSINGQAVSHSEFSFMYHYVLIENGVDIHATETPIMLAAPGEGEFATNRDFFIDIAAKELQTIQILYDDAILHGFSISDVHVQRAKTYIDWLSTKADAIHVDLDTYIKGTFGQNVTRQTIIDSLSKRYFAEDYAAGPKLEELKASEDQAEESYLTSSNQYDIVSYRVLRIVFEQKDQSFISTAHLHAQEIIEKIEHDPSRFEIVASEYFSGEARDALLKPDSTLISNVRFGNIDNLEWRIWLFDANRQPGDCTIFDDEYGFPILVCFSSRSRQIEPLRNIRFFYVNELVESTLRPGLPAGEVIPTAQTILDSISDETSVINLETKYSDEIQSGIMSAVQSGDTYKGKYDSTFDSWIFDPARKPGDKTMIELEDQVVILYFSSISPNPEWFDRVNSFIRMNNYQEFLLDKQNAYPIKLNPEGLKHI